MHTHTHRCPLHTQYLLRFFPLLLLRAEQRRLLDVTPEQLTVSPLAKLLKTSQLDALNPAAQVDRHLAGRFCLRVCGRVKEIVCACVCECVFSLSLSLSQPLSVSAHLNAACMHAHAFTPLTTLCPMHALFISSPHFPQVDIAPLFWSPPAPLSESGARAFENGVWDDLDNMEAFVLKGVRPRL